MIIYERASKELIRLMDIQRRFYYAQGRRGGKTYELLQRKIELLKAIVDGEVKCDS